MSTLNMKRVAVFIDGNNFYFGLRKLYGKNKSLKNFDFERFSKLLAVEGEVVAIYYYNALLDKKHNSEKYESQKEFFSRLRQIPHFNLVLCKLLKRNITGTNKFYYIIKEDDINMAVDMVEGACDNKFDVAILVSGDGDFVPAVNSVKNKDKEVINIYFKTSSSRNLKDNCNESIELTKEKLDHFFEEDKKENESKDNN
ncbi:MAG TPA: NYN domain-containing protein [Nanoarchaeota archaeon]|nr:NYN domain-containing protein [Nanoarchaeota archaeon]